MRSLPRQKHNGKKLLLKFVFYHMFEIVFNFPK